MAGYPNTVKTLFRGGYNVNCMADAGLFNEIKALDMMAGAKSLFPPISGAEGLPIRENDLLFRVGHDNSLPIIKSDRNRYDAFGTPGIDNYSKVPIFGSLNGLQQMPNDGNRDEARLKLQNRLTFHSVNKKNISPDGTTTGYKGGTCSIVNNTTYAWKSQMLGMLRVPTDKEVRESQKYMDQRDQQAKRVVPIIVPLARAGGRLSVLFSTLNIEHTKEATRAIADPMLTALNTFIQENPAVGATNPNSFVQDQINRKDPSAMELMSALDQYADERNAMACVRFEQDVSPGNAGVVHILS